MLLWAALVQAAITLVGVASIPGDALDRSGQAGKVLDNSGKPTEVARLLEQNSGGMIRVGKQRAESSVALVAAAERQQ